MPVFNTPISVYGTSGFLSVSQAERPVLRTPEQVHDFLSQFGTIEMWEVDDRHTSGEKVLRFFLTPRLRDVLGPAAHIVREINATGFKVCLFPAGLLPLKGLAEVLDTIAKNPQCQRLTQRRQVNDLISHVRAKGYPLHAVRAYTCAMVALVERTGSRTPWALWGPGGLLVDEPWLTHADALCRALLDGMENARRGRRLPHPEDQARVLRLALNAAPPHLAKFAQLCADEYARG